MLSEWGTKGDNGDNGDSVLTNNFYTSLIELQDGTVEEGIKAEQRAAVGTAGEGTSSSSLAIADEQGTTSSSKAMKKMYK